MTKYVFTPEMDKEIIYTYSINTDSQPRLINLAKKFNMPRWAIYQRALKIGAVKSSHQKKKWKDEEIKMLDAYISHYPMGGVEGADN